MSETNEPDEPDDASPRKPSTRQLEILQLIISEGMQTSGIAKALDISPKTVKNHLAAAYIRLGVNNRTAAVCMAIKKGYCRLD